MGCAPSSFLPQPKSFKYVQVFVNSMSGAVHQISYDCSTQLVEFAECVSKVSGTRVSEEDLLLSGYRMMALDRSVEVMLQDRGDSKESPIVVILYDDSDYYTARRCKVPSCRASHTTHRCHLCGDEDSDHLPDHCPRSTVLYHQTGHTAAMAIKASGKMRRGLSGMAGPGIYFAETPQHTNEKARGGSGYMVTARVYLGNSKHVYDPCHETYTSLKAVGYDSVTIQGRRTGTEYVVYNWDQVKVLDVSTA
mmetsp:Transcript_8322/g.20333  ORF Transcript_8322/g.20333 Transcript_8322/m.20333 type:complete len:250 (+) Transcript_8322:84-833(+)